MADHPDAGKLVQIDGNVVGTLFDVFRDGDDLVEQLRKRAAFIGASYGIIDEFSELGEGSTTKYLSATRSKQLTMNSLLKIASALGLRALFVVDEELTRRQQARWTKKRDSAKVHARRSPQLGQAQLKRILPAAAAEMGRRGAAARLKRSTPEERRRIAQLGAAVRWGHRASVREGESIADR
jgi:hypothetical protein